MRPYTFKSVIICVAIFTLLFSCSNAKSKKDLEQKTEIQTVSSGGIIPQPTNFFQSEKTGFTFKNGVKISGDTSLTNEKNYLHNILTHLGVNRTNNTAEISLNIEHDMPVDYHQISCKENTISIYGGSPEAVFHGIQSLHQIISIETKDSELPILSAFEVSDQPKFKWRGMLLDCCRHYFPKEVVLKYIDLLAFYKFNTLHWHITEDQAWRIAIDAYPKLTEIGAWREDKLATNGEKYGGFYTKEDIKEIVKYASERHIQIVPEIEMPGHSSAAVAAYPELGCTGEQISVPNDWGVFKDIYCPSENTFEFLETVLTEVMELFPSDYVHIGGDEAPKTRWEESEFCQELMKSEELHDFEEMQSYFINRIAEFLDKNGKTIIGWDEILNDELTETAIIQSWRGMDGGKKAVSEGRNAIMSPTSHCYLDYSLKAIDTEKLYGFNPIPDSCSAAETNRILGAECNMWTEHVPDEETLDSKVFPRLIAASEAFWGTNDDYEGFVKRLDAHYPVLKNMGVDYGNETVAISVKTNTDKEQITVELTENLRNPQTSFSLINNVQNLDAVYDYTGEEISIEQRGKNTLTINARTEITENSEQFIINFNHHDWLTAPIKYSVPFSDYYTAGGKDGLTDGVLGSLDFRDGHWQGFFGDDVELVLENPNAEKAISSVSMNFYRYINSWIFPPESVTISVSKDGENWSQVGFTAYAEKEMHVRGKDILSPSFEFNNIEANYIKVNIKNIGKVPHWHEASTEPAWVFLDEVVVK